MRRREARHVGKQNGGRHGQTRANPEHARVEADVERANRKPRGAAGHENDERPRQRDAQQRSGAAQDQALGEERTPQGAVAGAERRAHGQLPFTSHRAREDEIGDVRAGNHEHDRRRRKQEQKDRPRGCRDLIAKRPRTDLDVGIGRVGLRVFADDGGMHGAQLRARVLQRDARRKTTEELRHPMRAPRLHRRAKVVRAGDDVGDDFGIGRVGHRGLEDAYHRRWARSEAYRSPNNRWVSIERGRPESISQDRGRRGVRPIISRVQEAAKHRTKTHHLEERSVDDAGLDHAGHGPKTDQGKVDRGELAKRGDAGDAGPEVLNLGHRERHVRGADARSALANVDQPIFIAIDQRSQQHASNNAEGGSVCANAERERHHDRRRQTFGPQKRAHSDSHVADESDDRVEPAAVPNAPH